MERSLNKATDPISRSTFLAFSLIAVFAGGMIYILFRPAEPVFYSWFNAAGFEDWLTQVRERSLSLGQIFPQWFIYSLPAGLWAYGYTSIVLCIWTGSRSMVKFFWFGSIPVLVFGFELLQLTGNLPGTFCLSDILWSAIGIAAGFSSVYLGNQRKKYQNTENKLTSPIGPVRNEITI